MSTLIPKRTLAREILTGILLRIGHDKEKRPLFPSLKEIPDLTKDTGIIPNFQTRFSRCYGSNGVPDADLHQRLVLAVNNYASNVDLVKGVTPEHIIDALNAAFARLGTHQLTVVDDLLFNTDLNDIGRWQRVVLIASEQDPLMQGKVRNAIFQNLVDAGRGRRTVDLRIFLESSLRAEAYKDALMGSVWFEMQALAPSTDRAEVEDLFNKVLGGGTLKIEVRDDDLTIDVARFAVAYFIGHEGTIATNLGREVLPKDPSSMDLWEEIADQLLAQEPLKENGEVHTGGAKKSRSTMRVLEGMPL